MKRIILTMLVLQLFMLPSFATNVETFQKSNKSEQNTNVIIQKTKSNKILVIKKSDNNSVKTLNPKQETYSYVKSTKTLDNSYVNVDTKNQSEYLRTQNQIDEAARIKVQQQTKMFVTSRTQSTLFNDNMARSLDPFVVKIENQKYLMIKDNSKGVYDIKNILGYQSTATNVFKMLTTLNSDSDKTKISAKELKKSNIRFVRLSENNILELKNKSLDYPLNKISYIDLKTLRTTKNNGIIGAFGYFDMYLTDCTQIIGQVTYMTPRELLQVLGE